MNVSDVDVALDRLQAEEMRRRAELLRRDGPLYSHPDLVAFLAELNGDAS